jgi:hypothetical protein
MDVLRQRVDLGIWKSIPTAVLSCPLVHSGNVARKLGLLTKTKRLSKAVANWTKLRLDPNDPVKYDFTFFWVFLSFLVYIKK